MIIETFSKRLRKLKGEAQDVFTYDNIPIALRVQIVKIWIECMGLPRRNYMGENPAFAYLHDAIATEFGMFSLGNAQTHCENLINFFTNKANTQEALDIIDAVFHYVSLTQHKWDWGSSFEVSARISTGIDTLNQRFLEHGIGYTFIEGDNPQLIQKNNEHLHQEVVIPVLQLLHAEAFKGANDEYLLAHEHYRHGRYKECLNDCLKAFESTMKTICAKKKWPFKSTDTASPLIDTCLKNGLLPPYMQTHLGTVKSALESAIPTLRNKNSGHGQGEVPVAVAQFYAEYLLHETATTIMFLLQAFKASK